MFQSKYVETGEETPPKSIICPFALPELTLLKKIPFLTGPHDSFFAYFTKSDPHDGS